MLKMGMITLSLLSLSGCASLMSEDPAIAQARQQAEQANQARHSQLQAEAERLRAAVQEKKSELGQY